MSFSAPAHMLTQRVGGQRAEQVACSHCGLPVPAGLRVENAEHQFCCDGCRTVWDVLHVGGLTEYYKLRDIDPAAQRVRAKPTGRRFSEFDEHAFRDAFCRQQSDGSASVELYLEGVHCPACVWLVERLPTLVEGVIDARLELRRSLLRLRWDPERAGLSGIARKLDSMGYVPQPAKSASVRERRRCEDRRFLVSLGVAGACVGNVMLVSIALWAGGYTGIEPWIEQLFRWVSAVVGVVCLAWPGMVFLRGALGAVRARRWHLDLPITISLVLGSTISMVNTIRGSGEIYFDSLTMLIFFLLIGRWLQSRQQRASADAVELLYTLTPRTARRVREGGVEEIAAEAVVVGDLVEVLGDESCPVDGVVVSGTSSVDNSILTGESEPVPVREGDEVAAGVVVRGSSIRVRAEQIGASTRLGRIMSMLEDLASRRTPFAADADKLARHFVVCVIVVASACFAFWSREGFMVALDHALAVLIVACPCALALATPIATSIAIGRAAQRGILIKGGDVLGKLTRPGAVYFDKTGTLTEGRYRVLRWRGDTDAQRLAVALETVSAHAVARAIVQSAAGTPAGTNIARHEVLPGRGIRGVVDGHDVVVGSRSLVADTRDPEGLVRATEQEAHGLGGTAIYVSVGGVVRASVILGDSVRDSAASAVRGVRTRGWRASVLSGDDERVALAVGQRLGVPEQDIVGNASPEDKARIIEHATNTQGTVVMVGDGVNDAGALARADVGVAVRGGAEASLAAADVYLSGKETDGLAQIATLLDGSAQTIRTVRLALGVSLGYNILAAGCAFAGVITPLWAAIIMPISSLSVVWIGLSGRAFRR